MDKLKLFILSVLLGVLVLLVTDYNSHPSKQTFLFVGDISINALDRARILHALDNAELGDTVVLKVRSFGGYVYGLAPMITSLEHTLASVTVEVDAYAMSAAAVLTCHADKVKYSKYSIAMFHLPRTYDVLGNAKVITDKDDNTFKYFETMFNKCKRFLTPMQLNSYYAGEDVYITPKQMNKGVY